MTDTKENVLKRLFALERKGMKPGLERTLAVLSAIGNPHKKFPSIHIAGTNGKGSVASLIASILSEAGYKVGLYTSPHIKDFNERIKIGNQMISDEEMLCIAQKLLDEGKKVDATFFEITTALAFQHFADKNIDVAVVETGLGGRFDSTNVLLPLLSVITSIDIDHTDYLGSTLKEIAFEKAGIIKLGVPCIVAEAAAEVRNTIIEVALENFSDITFSTHLKCEIVGYEGNLKMRLNIESERAYYMLLTPLAGKHQAVNHTLAVAAAEKLSRQFHISDENIINGVKNVKLNTRLRSRVEVISSEPLIILDTAHNPAAFAALRDLLSQTHPNTKFNLLFGAMSDKDIASMLVNIKPIVSDLIITEPKIKRAESISQIEKFAVAAGFEHLVKIQEPQGAYLHAKSLGNPLLVAGSFYLLGDIDA